MTEYERINNQIDEIYKECRVKDWDSYDANPVTEKAIEKAKEILKDLQRYGDILLSELEAEPCPDGKIMFEKIVNNDEYRILIV
ncbi:hypothetical protein LCGC14_2714650 [marine sediment metagenome]|uniref:Uncharacterized protein n=1 Tax=marine sediment metagenome TaxID=412755 RepID=A0A0F9C3L7_9ZZZZ